MPATCQVADNLGSRFAVFDQSESGADLAVGDPAGPATQVPICFTPFADGVTFGPRTGISDGAAYPVRNPSVQAASEASAQRKLADAEAALKKAKEEAQRASGEAERAKAEAQSAKELEAAIKSKLADAIAARAKAEQACRSGDAQRPGLGTRLRRWLGRPRPPNP